MTRSTRLALLLALVTALALPQAVAAAPPDRSEGGPSATPESWFARLWAPLAHLIGRADAAGGPEIDPNGVAAPPPTASHAATDGGPTIDPNGLAALPPPDNTQTDGGPDIDPDG